MNAVQYAINRLHGSDIDEYLLKLAFEQNPNTNWSGNWYNTVNATTIDQGVLEKVIHRTVLPACNARGGKTEYIDISSSRIRDLGNGCIEVNVPDIITGGRKIISVAEVYLGSMTSATGMLGIGINDNALCGQGAISDMTQSLLDSITPSRMFPVTFTNIHMTGNNSFVIFGMNSGTFSMSAKMTLEYDEGLSSISPRHHELFADLVELAVKAYIYRTCRRPTSDAVKRAGVALDDIKDDIANYRSAWDDYKEMVKTTWTNAMAWSDRLTVNETIKSSVPRRM
ncbi:hypothetical protein D3C79_48080 [compost metagenome]